METERSKLAIIAVVCFLVGASGVVVAFNLSASVQVSGGVPLGAPDGMTVTLEGSTQANLEDISTLGGTVNIVTQDGNATFYSPGVANATVHANDIEGTWTNVTAIDAGQNTVQIDPDDKPQATVGGSINAFDWRAGITEDDGTVDFAYSGGTGNSRVTVRGVSASTTLTAVDASSGAFLDQATSDSNGIVTFDALDSGDHDVVIQTNANDAPALSNASPTGLLSSEPSQFSVDVNDANFDQGDTVTVTIDYDGSQVHSETISSNQTVTASIPSAGSDGGSHSWSVDATDDFGGSASDSYMYSVPSELTFREEAPPHSVIENGTTDPIVVEAVFFEDVEDTPTIINRTTTDGTIDLDGLPVSSKFAVSVTAPGYHNRTVLLDNIYEQSNVFLVDQSQNTVENRFLVSDRTGNFPAAETSIKVQAPINESIYASGGINWLTIAGDDLGADEAFVTDLVDGKRYRILVENEDGDQRNLGAYTAETTGTINLNIGKVDLTPTEYDGIRANATWSNATGSPVVKFGYNDSTDNTTSITVDIYERNNETNTLVDNQTYSGDYGVFTLTEPVPTGEEDTTWVVEVTAERDGGDDIEIRDLVGPGAPVLTDMPPWLVTIVFVGMIWGVAGLFSQFNGHVGGLIVAGLGGMFYFVGLVPPFLGGGVVALALLTAGIMFVREGRGGGL